MSLPSHTSSPGASSAHHPPAAGQRSRRWLARLFWTVLAVFIAWDVMVSAPIDLRNEPPLIAAGSGRPIAGGHCSMSK